MGTSPYFLHHFYKDKQYCDFLFASLKDKAPLRWDLLLKERICSCRSKFFPLRVDPTEKGGKIDDGVATLEGVPTH